MKKLIFALVSIVATCSLLGGCAQKVTTMAIDADGVLNSISWETTEEGIEKLVPGYTWYDIKGEDGTVGTRQYYKEIPKGQVAEDGNASCRIAYSFNQDDWGGMVQTGVLSGWVLTYTFPDGASSDALKGKWESKLTELFGAPSEDDYGDKYWERTNYTIGLYVTGFPNDNSEYFSVAANYRH